MKIAICAPHRTFALTRWLSSIDKVSRACAKREGVSVAFHGLEGCSLLEHARSMVAQTAINEGADVLLWADDDIEFDESAVMLIDKAFELESIVAAPASIRGGEKLNVNFVPTDRPIRFGEAGSLYEVYSAGFGLVAVHRDVFMDVAAKLPKVRVLPNHPKVHPFFQCEIREMDDGELQWCGEDQIFCIRAREAGRQIWADTRVKAVHWTPHGHTVQAVLEDLVSKNLGGSGA